MNVETRRSTVSATSRKRKAQCSTESLEEAPPGCPIGNLSTATTDQSNPPSQASADPGAGEVVRKPPLSGTNSEVSSQDHCLKVDEQQETKCASVNERVTPVAAEQREELPTEHDQKPSMEDGPSAAILAMLQRLEGQLDVLQKATEDVSAKVAGCVEKIWPAKGQD